MEMTREETQEIGALWYAFGWLDSHPNINANRKYPYDAHEFAFERLQTARAFNRGQINSMEPIWYAWKEYRTNQDKLEIGQITAR